MVGFSGVWRLSYGIEEMSLASQGGGRDGRGGRCLLLALVLCVLAFRSAPWAGG